MLSILPAPAQALLDLAIADSVMKRNLLLLVLHGPIAQFALGQPPTIVYHPDQWGFSWCERLADERYFSPVHDVPECRTFDAGMYQVAAWRYMDPLGGVPVVYNGVLPGPEVMSFGVVRYDPSPGEVRTKMAVTRVTPLGELVQQYALLFEGGYAEAMAGAGHANVKIATNGQGEAFVTLRRYNNGWANHILKLGADGIPVWQVSFPTGHYLPGVLEPDPQGGVWFCSASTGFGTSHPSFQIGRLDADGEVVFWNDYRRPGGTYRDACLVRDNGDLGFVVTGMDDNQLFWMAIDDQGHVNDFRLNSPLESDNVRDAVHGLVRVGEAWVALQGIANDRLVFFDQEGTVLRAYIDSVHVVQDTVQKWAWNTLEGRGGWAIMTGYHGKHDATGNTYEYRPTLTQLKEEEWEHCMIQPASVQQVVVPVEQIAVQALEGTDFEELPEMVPGDLIVEQIPIYPAAPMCDLLTATKPELPSGAELVGNVVTAGEPLRLVADGKGSVYLRDMLGRDAGPREQVPGGHASVPTEGLTSGTYMLIFTNAEGQVSYTAKVVVL